MRWSTRSAGNLKTPIKSDERMTSCVTLSRASPRNPLRSPGRIQRGPLGFSDVGGSSRGDHQLARGGLGALGQSRAPREASAIVGHLAEFEFDGRPEMPEEAQARAIGLSFTLVVGVQLDLEARIDALGVRRQEIPQPASDFRVGPAGEHGEDLNRGYERRTRSRGWGPARRGAHLVPGGAGFRPRL